MSYARGAAGRRAWAACRTPVALPVDALGRVSYARGAAGRRTWAACRTPVALPVDALGRVSYARGAAGRRAGPRVVRPWRCRSTRWAACRTPVALPVDALGYVSYALSGTAFLGLQEDDARDCEFVALYQFFSGDDA